jgi:hypothetical protein
MNPLIVYYNQAVFEMLDLDPPTEEWGIQELNDIIWKLKHAGQGYLFRCPHIRSSGRLVYMEDVLLRVMA